MTGPARDGTDDMTTETTVDRAFIEATIACHDGWNLYVYRATGYEQDGSGIDGVELTRGSGDAVHVPAEDIPALIEALSRLARMEAR